MNSLSDKALLQLVRNDRNDQAAALLLKRMLGHGANPSPELLEAWRKPKFLTVNAAKKIALAH